jgi:hypothetical protein
MPQAIDFSPVTDGIATQVQAEAHKSTRNKSAIAQTLETGLTYAKNLHGFADAIETLEPHVQNAAAGWDSIGTSCCR